MRDVTDLHKAIGANMKARRTALGLSLDDVAFRASMSKSGVWEIEQGRNPNPTIKTALRLCDALSMSLNSLLGFDAAQPRVTDAELALIAAHRQLFGEQP